MGVVHAQRSENNVETRDFDAYNRANAGFRARTSVEIAVRGGGQLRVAHVVAVGHKEPVVDPHRIALRSNTATEWCSIKGREQQWMEVVGSKRVRSFYPTGQSRTLRPRCIV